jgi:glycine/serine hydroxymethyltransferase
LEYQKIEGNIIKLENELSKSTDREKAAEIQKELKNHHSRLVTLEENAKKVNNAYTLAIKKYQEYNEKLADLEKMLDEAHITANKNSIPNDPEKPFVTSGLRVGTPAITTRGMKEEDMKVIADCIADVIFKGEAVLEDVKARVIALCDKYPIYENDVMF